ncbi:MAG: hypothetical protein ACE5KU_00055 [Nitrososphaerales archaeon]
MRKPFSEKRIHSLRELKKIIEFLDLDEGVRVLGRIEGLRGGGFIFITTSHSATESSQRYCVNTAERIYDEEAKMHLPGGREEFLYFSDVEEVVKYIEKNADKPLRAWNY